MCYADTKQKMVGDRMRLPEEISAVLGRFEAHGFSAFVVGGCVRDSLLGLSPKDWDVCTAAKPAEVQALFSECPIYLTGEKHGTVTLLFGETKIEITTFRQDGAYHDFRHPDSVAYTPDVKEDLARRDFTINAMAYSPKSGLLDFFGGREDLRRGILSCVGDPRLRFSEDALRILRALRFASVYGFQIERQTAEAIRGCKGGLKAISAERIWSEMGKTLEAPSFSQVLADYPDILALIFPAAEQFFAKPKKEWRKFIQEISQLPPQRSVRLLGLLFWCCVVFPSLSKAEYLQICYEVMRYLKVDRKTLQRGLRLAEGQYLLLPHSLAETRILAGRYGMEGMEDFLAWKAVEKRVLSSDEEVAIAMKYWKEIQEKKLCCTIGELEIDGHDIKAAGIKDGAEIGQALRRALAEVVAERLPNEKNALINFLFP